MNIFSQSSLNVEAISFFKLSAFYSFLLSSEGVVLIAFFYQRGAISFIAVC